MRKLFVMLLLLPVSLLTLSGCLAVVAGGAAGGGVAYAKGDLNAQFDTNLSRLNNAAVSAGEGLGFHQISSDSDNLSGKHIFRTADDKRVTITTKKVSDNVSAVSIRVGTFGDESMSYMILERIKRGL